MKNTVKALFILVAGIVQVGICQPATDFYRQQIEKLENLTPVLSENLNSTFNFPPITNNSSFENSIVAKAAPKKIFDIENLVDTVLNFSHEAEKQRNIAKTARYNLSQTQAIEPFLRQIISFANNTPLLTPLQKDHPEPGVAALKLEIANLVSTEAEARLQLFLVGLAKKARILGAQLVQIEEKLRLVRKTLNLYQDLLNSSTLLYRNGQISFGQYSMIRIETNQLETIKNQYSGEKIHIQEQIYDLLGSARPDLRLKTPDREKFSFFETSFPDLQNHPALAIEESVLERLDSSIALIRRLTFPEYSSVSAIPTRATDSGTMNFMVPDSNKAGTIEFKRTFIRQLQTRRNAQKAALDQAKSAITSNFRSNLSALKFSNKNLSILQNKIVPELEKAFQSVKSTYESGKADFQTLTETERKLLKAKEKQIGIEYEIIKLQAELFFNLGLTGQKENKQ